MKKIISLLAILLVCASGVQAASNKKLEILGTFGDWTAYSANEKSGKLCYMASVPQKSEGKYKRRGDVILIVAHRPKEKSPPRRFKSTNKNQLNCLRMKIPHGGMIPKQTPKSFAR